MKSFVIYAPNRSELSLLSSQISFLIRKAGQNRLPLYTQKLDAVQQYLEYENVLQFFVCDVTARDVIPLLEQLRQHNGQMKLVLLADGTVPPVNYIRPTILPTALLWRPLQEDSTRQSLWEVINSLKETQEQEENLFTLDVRGVVKKFAYRDILFFEARDKKLYMHSNRQEIPFPGTLERLLDELPGEFIRVHKSYIVNRTRVSEIQYGQNLLLVEGGMMVPLSRSYKAEVKAVFA